MKALMFLSGFICLSATIAASQQNSDSPIAVLESSWFRKTKTVTAERGGATEPVRLMTPENKNFQRAAREQQSKGAIDPNEYTVDGRSAALEKNVQRSRAVGDVRADGFVYATTVRNDGKQKAEIVYWEYRFIELANPQNIVRRQFLCAANLKPGEKRELAAFSSLGPSDVISVESLSKDTEKRFDEKIFINRIENADGTILQRRDWNLADVKPAVERVTATPWGREVCKAL
jgi:hypothetical protein